METKKKHELSELLSRLGIVNGEARRLRDEIEAGDQLLAQNEAEELNPAVRARILAAMRKELRGHAWRTWAIRVAAVILVVLIPAYLVVTHAPESARDHQPGGTSPTVADHEIFTDQALWELALESNEAQPGVDDLAYAEYSLLNEQQS